MHLKCITSVVSSKQPAVNANEARQSKKVAPSSARVLTVLTVSPGKLGLTLSVLPNGEGAKIVAIDPACTFKGKVELGDRIVTIDGKRVEKLEDLTVGKEKMRKFGIAKEAQIIANKKAVAEAKAAAEASKFKPYDKDRKQAFPYLNLLKANGNDRAAEHIREDIMTELLQWDKRKNIDVSSIVVVHTRS